MREPTPAITAARRQQLPRWIEGARQRITQCENKLATVRTSRARSHWGARLRAAKRELRQLTAEWEGTMKPMIDEQGYVLLVHSKEQK